MTTFSRHYTWIDYARFFSIALVVYFHCPPSLPPVPHTYLSLMRLPCFFAISGLLFRFDKYPAFFGFVQHRAKQLLIPYFCFFAVFYVYWLLIGHKNGTEDDLNAPLYLPLLEYLYGRPNLVCTPLWFISCLFTLQCVFYLLFKKVRNRLIASLLLFVFPFIPVFVHLSNAPWMLDDVCIAMPFYGLACLFRSEIMQFVEDKKRFLWAFIGLAIHLLIVFLLIDRTDPYLKTLLRTIGSVCIITTVFVLMKLFADILGKKRFVDYIARNAVVVLACHGYVIQIIFMLTYHVAHASPDFFEGKYLLKLLMAIFILISMIVPIYIINRYIPFMIGKGTSSKISA